MENRGEFVTVQKVFDPMEAELLRSRLEDQHIECLLKTDNAGGTLPYLTANTGIEIIVLKEDADKARAILEKAP